MPTGIYDRSVNRNYPDPGTRLHETERAYLAGIIDGEGSIMVIHHKACPPMHKWEFWVLRVLVVNTDRRLIDWLIARFGGWCATARSKNPKWKDTYHWKLDSKRAHPVLAAAMPYLLLKRKQAELALEFIGTHKLVGRRGHSEETIALRRNIAGAIRRLNARGKLTPISA